MHGDDRNERADRLNALSPLQRDELAHIIGEASLDLWVYGEPLPNVVEQCLEAVEEDEPSVLVTVRAKTDRDPGVVPL